MLEADEIEENFGNREAWDCISTYLCGKNDRKSCCFLLCGESVLLARWDCFKLGLESKSQGSPFSALKHKPNKLMN